MKQQFDSQSPYRKQTFEDEFIRFCQSMLNEVERKIAKGKLRLSLSGKAEAVRIATIIHIMLLYFVNNHCTKIIFFLFCSFIVKFKSEV
jgi:predicted RNA-binding protein